MREPLRGWADSVGPSLVRPAPLRPAGSELGGLLPAVREVDRVGQMNPVRRDRRKVLRRISADPHLGAGMTSQRHVDEDEDDGIADLNPPSGPGQGIDERLDADVHSTGMAPVKRET